MNRTHTNGNKHIYIYICTQNLKTHSHLNREKIAISKIRNHFNTHTTYQISKVNEG